MCVNLFDRLCVRREMEKGKRVRGGISIAGSHHTIFSFLKGMKLREFIHTNV